MRVLMMIERFYPYARLVLLALVSAVFLFSYLWLALFFCNAGAPFLGALMVLLLIALFVLSLLSVALFFLRKKKV